jgi:hypothetical protein
MRMEEISGHLSPREEVFVFHVLVLTIDGVIAMSEGRGRITWNWLGAADRERKTMSIYW